MSVIKTIGTGGDYSTIANWISLGIPTTLADDYIGRVKNQTWSQSTQYGHFTGTTTGSFKVILEADVGASFRDNVNASTNELRPNASNGVCLICTGDYSTAIAINIDNVTIRNLQIDGTGGTSSLCVNINGAPAPSNTVLDSCIFRGSSRAGGSSDYIAGVYTNGIIKNCVGIVTTTLSSTGAIFFLGSSAKAYFCTAVRAAVLSASGNAYKAAYGSCEAYDCAAFNCSTAFGGTAWNTASKNNATNLASIGNCGGTGHLTSLTFANQFVNIGSVSATSIDCRLLSTADLVDAGVAAGSITVDIIGQSRSSPDIGAWEWSPPGTLEQEGFRFAEDDGSESSASWIAAQDTNITRQLTTNTRLRIIINSTGNSSATNYRLEYQESGGNWRKVDI
jgi:hypothetical protein